jgi:DNA replication protein DnaC
LAAAIANQRVELGDSPLFVMVPDLLDHLRATFSPTSSVSYDRRFDEIRTSSLLILDDLGTQSMTPWVREKLYQLFNHRYNAKLSTVITTADTMDEMDDRIRSRMLDDHLCKIFAITAPAFYGGRTRKTKR